MTAFTRFLQGSNSIRGATFLLVITLTLSNILGLVRDRLLAAKIPADQLDSYYAAFRLPDFLTNLFVVGAIAVIFLPIFTELRTRDEARAWSVASAILNITILLLTLAGIGLVIGMPWLMGFVVPQFGPEKFDQTVFLARWLAITPVLFGFSYLLSGIVNSFQRFAVYAFAPLVYNTSIIVATVFFADRFGVYGVVIGVVIGALLHMLIQLPIAIALGWRWQPTLTILDPSVRRVGRLMVPRIIGLGAAQVTTIVSTAIASSWGGAIAYYNFANNIQTMPTAVFANSIATALFPSLSLAAANHNKVQFTNQIVQGIRWILFLLIPASVGLILLRIQIVRLVLGAGFFGWEATQTTADVLGWFALSLVASGLVPLLARAYYARQDMQTPMAIGVIGATITIILSYLLTVHLPVTSVIFGRTIHTGEVAGLAIAFSIGMLANACLLYIRLRKDFGINTRDVTRSLAKILFATLAMALAVQGTKTLLGYYLPLELAVGVLVQTGSTIVIGIGVYGVVVSWLQCDEWRELSLVLKKKISSLISTKPA